jgi:hypothetical protein
MSKKNELLENGRIRRAGLCHRRRADDDAKRKQMAQDGAPEAENLRRAARNW